MMFPVPGSTIETAAALRLSSSGGMKSLTVLVADWWTFGSRVVRIV